MEDEDIPDYADDFEDEEDDSEYVKRSTETVKSSHACFQQPGGRTGKEKDWEEGTEKLEKRKKSDLDLQRVDEVVFCLVIVSLPHKKTERIVGIQAAHEHRF